jgi:mRNA-degrading endonuclease YafQ of YafQ-DinJ toxin-antitoxin module
MAKKASRTDGRFEKTLALFSDNPFHPSLKTHSLTGNLQDYWAFSITYEYRLLFRFLSEEKELLIDIGSHDEVY